VQEANQNKRGGWVKTKTAWDIWNWERAFHFVLALPHVVTKRGGASSLS